MIHVNSANNVIRLILLLAISSMVAHADGHTNKEQKLPLLQAQELTEKPRQPRLKFRNGPVCMCSQGLSEKEIQLQSTFRSIK